VTGQQIKKLRVKLGETQERFARLIGVTFSTVNRWENDANNTPPNGLVHSLLVAIETALEGGAAPRIILETGKSGPAFPAGRLAQG
jgi:transcriptional regulator with XRE-family HTH domain